MRFLEKKLKNEKSTFTIPKSVQDVIPIKTIYGDGIFYLDKNKFSKCYRFSDTNYTAEDKEVQESIFFNYSGLVNSFDSGTENKITIINRRINEIEFANAMLISSAKDKLDIFRDEINKILISDANRNGVVQEKFITTTVEKKNVQDARTYFSRVGAEFSNHFATLDSKCMELDCRERMMILHDSYRTGKETEFRFNIKESIKKKIDCRCYY